MHNCTNCGRTANHDDLWCVRCITEANAIAIDQVREDQVYAEMHAALNFNETSLMLWEQSFDDDIIGRQQFADS